MNIKFGLGVTTAHTGLRGILASEPSEVSLLFWLSYINKGASRDSTGRVIPGTVELLGNTEGGAQQDKVEGSAWGISNQLHEKQLMGKVIFNSAVREIKQNGGMHAQSILKISIGLILNLLLLLLFHITGGCTVITWDGRTYNACRVVVAIPPALAGRIRFDPPLPTLKDQVFQRHAMGGVIKVQFET